MNMMMNHTRYLQKQVAMMQATAIQHQFSNTGGSGNGAMPPAPQLMPNVSRSTSFSGPPGGATAASLYPQPGHYAQNPSDPFLMTAPMRHPSGKINLNAAPMLAAPTPMKTAISRLPAANKSDPMSFSNSFDFGSEFDSSAVSFPDDALLSDYLMSQTAGNTGDNNGGYIDPSSILALHEY